jgi:hypothetical protein
VISASEAPPPLTWWMTYPVCFFILGAVLTFNIRGAADYLYLRIERRVAVSGGIGPRTLRIFGAMCFGSGGISVTVEVVTRL